MSYTCLVCLLASVNYFNSLFCSMRPKACSHYESNKEQFWGHRLITHGCQKPNVIILILHFLIALVFSLKVFFQEKIISKIVPVRLSRDSFIFNDYNYFVLIDRSLFLLLKIELAEISPWKIFRFARSKYDFLIFDR